MAKGRQLLARFKPGENLPVWTDDANIAAGRFVKVTGRNARGAYKGVHAGAGEYANGVAETDAVGSVGGVLDWRGGTNLTRRGCIARVEMGAAATVGAAVKSDTQGRAIPQGGSGVILGYFLGLNLDAGGNATAAGQVGGDRAGLTAVNEMGSRRLREDVVMRRRCDQHERGKPWGF